MDISGYTSFINSAVTNQVAPFSISPATIGSGFTSLATITKASVEQKLDISGSTSFLTGITANQISTALGYVPSSGVTLTGITVNTSQIIDKAVTTDKISFLTSGRNLFNPYDSGFAVGSYIQSANGILAVSGTYNATGYMSVSGSTSYAISPTSASLQNAWYDSGKTFISGFNGTNTSTVVNSPSGATYLRCSLGSGNTFSFQVEQNTGATSYELYSLVFKPATGLKISADNVSNNAINQISSAITIGTSQIANNAVTKDKVNFFAVGKNKFNINATDNVLGNYVAYNTGTLFSSASYNTTGYIPVLSGSTYTVSYKNQIAYYDINKAYLSGDNTNSNTNNKQITIPANVAYVRCTVTIANWSSFQIELGSSATVFAPYSLILSSPDGTPIIITGSTVAISDIQNLLTVNRAKPATIAVAPKLYVAKGKEIAIYYENINKYYDEYKGKTDITLAGATIAGRAAKWIPSSTGSTSATITLVNEQFDNILITGSTITVTDPAINTAVKILNIGDSYTLRSGFVNPLLTTAASANTTFYGLRTTTTATTITPVNCEGRGGSSLATYFTQDYSLNGNTGIYNPFMQPTATYLYYGRTDFWLLGINTPSNYDAGSYNVSNQFNATTGFKNSPNINDLMYDAANSTYKFWTGSVWSATTAPTFGFSYAKYRTAWSIPVVDVVHLMFGTNEWSAISETGIISQWAGWKTNMDAVISSIRADSPNTKIIIGIPNASNLVGNDGTMYYERRNRAFWYHASQIIVNYSGQEVSNKVYINDYHSGVDRIFGFPYSNDKPFNDFTGTAVERLPVDATHISADGFNQMGNYYLGLIQAVR